MVKKFFKKKSKRISCSTKYKIRHKVSEHNKKVKKVGNLKNTKLNKKKAQFNIPNSYPFKEQLLQEALDFKTKKKLDKKQKAQEKREQRLDVNISNIDVLDGNTSVVKSYPRDLRNKPSIESHFKTFRGLLKQVISDSNVLLLVLDARDPMGTCCLDIEKLIPKFQEMNKRLVLLLNKIDLVPHDVAMAWVKYLRTMAPTIPFKASVQGQQNNLGTANHSSSSSAFGREHLMKLLGNYSRSSHKTRSGITVGVIGMPNVGKSSVINSLKRKKVCEHGSVPGITRKLATIKIHKNLTLIDSPGVITNYNVAEQEQDGEEEEGDMLSLKNVIRIEQLEDPVQAVDMVLKKCDKKEIVLRYKIPSFETCDELLLEIARKFGKLKKGGTPDMEEAARHLIKDWNQGKIRYYTPVPINPIDSSQNKDKDALELLASNIVTQWSQEFDIDSLTTNPVISDTEMDDTVETEDME